MTFFSSIYLDSCNHIIILLFLLALSSLRGVACREEETSAGNSILDSAERKQKEIAVAKYENSFDAGNKEYKLPFYLLVGLLYLSPVPFALNFARK